MENYFINGIYFVWHLVRVPYLFGAHVLTYLFCLLTGFIMSEIRSTDILRVHSVQT